MHASISCYTEMTTFVRSGVPMTNSVTLSSHGTLLDWNNFIPKRERVSQSTLLWLMQVTNFISFTHIPQGGSGQRQEVASQFTLWKWRRELDRDRILDDVVAGLLYWVRGWKASWNVKRVAGLWRESVRARTSATSGLMIVGANSVRLSS